MLRLLGQGFSYNLILKWNFQKFTNGSKVTVAHNHCVSLCVLIIKLASAKLALWWDSEKGCKCT